MPIELSVSPQQESAAMFANWEKIRLVVTGPDEVERGKPVEVEVTLYNDDPNWQMIVDGGSELRPLALSVYNSHRQLCRSERGNELLRPTSLGYTLAGPVVAIAPSSSWTWKVNLAECFDLPPEAYDVVAAVDVSAYDAVHQKEFSDALRASGVIDGREIASDVCTIVVK